MPENNSITVGPFALRWNGQGLTVRTPGGQYELDGNEGYELLCWLYDEQRQHLFKSTHPTPRNELGVKLDIDALSRQFVDTVNELTMGTQPFPPED